MKTEITVPALVSAVCQVGEAYNRSANRPSSRHLLLRHRDGRLDVVATDLETIARASITAGGEGIGEVCVPLELARRVLSLLDEDLATMQRCDAGLQLDTASRRLVLPLGIPASDFPVNLSRDEGPETTVDGGALYRAVEAAAPFVCKDETRIHITGVRLRSKEEGQVEVVSTDGNRLCALRRPVAGLPAFEGVTIPHRAARAFVTMFGSQSRPFDEGAISLGVSPGRVSFRARDDSFEVVTAPIQRPPYPPWEQVIPSHEAAFFVRREPLWRAACYLWDVLGKGVAHGASIVIHDPNTILFKLVGPITDGPEAATATVPLASRYEGPPLAIGVNPSLLAEILNAMPAETVAVHIGDELEPMLITDADHDTDKFVLMPLKL